MINRTSKLVKLTELLESLGNEAFGLGDDIEIKIYLLQEQVKKEAKEIDEFLTRYSDEYMDFDLARVVKKEAKEIEKNNS
tara:strand:- start:7 stop:246 length:240 start_codon:yes stop_codon:yes gene_type:complete